jgi:hypothetical protein
MRMISSLELGCWHLCRWMDSEMDRDNPLKHRSAMPWYCRIVASRAPETSAGMDIAIVKTVARGTSGAPNPA